MSKLKKKKAVPHQLKKNELEILKDVLKQEVVFQDLQLSRLNVDYTYQTRPRDRLANQIAEHFSPAMLGTLMISQRPDQTFWVCDGVTRKIALECRGEGERYVRCQILQTSGQKQEALLFKFYNGNARKTVPLASRLQAEGIAGVDQGFLNLIEQCGFSLVGNSRKTLKGVSHILDAFKEDPEALKKALYAVKNTWWGARYRIDGTVIEGLTYVYKNSRNIDESVRKFLERTPPDKLDEYVNNVWGGGTRGVKPRLHPNAKPHWIAKAVGLHLNKANRNKVSVRVNLDRLDEMRNAADTR